MKNENRIKRRLKMAVKNQLHFERLIVQNGEELMRQFVLLRETYFPLRPGDREEFSLIAKGWNLAIALERGKDLISIIWEKINGLDGEKRSNFLREIDLLIVKRDLGKEWQDTFVVFILTGIFCPPLFNLYIGKEDKEPISDELTAGVIYGTVPAHDRVVLELNPDTSIEDIRDAMPEIKTLMKSRWPNYQSGYLPKNSFLKLHDTIKTKWEKIENKEPKSYAEIALKQLSSTEGKKAILANRRGIREEQKRKGPIKRYVPKRKKLTDMEIAKRRGLRGATLRKEINRIRQDRRRQKMTD